MTVTEELRGLGVDVDDGLDRVMGDSSLYEMMLGMFIESVDGNPISRQDFESDDLDSLIQRVHMLKGVTGNLAMTPIFTKYTETLELLRADKPEQAKEVFTQLLPAQNAILDCIKRHTSAQ